MSNIILPGDTNKEVEMIKENDHCNVQESIKDSNIVVSEDIHTDIHEDIHERRIEATDKNIVKNELYDEYNEQDKQTNHIILDITKMNNEYIQQHSPRDVIHNNDNNDNNDNISSDSILDILKQSDEPTINLIKKKKNGLYSLNTYDEIFFKKYKDRLVRKKEIYILSSEIFQKKSLFLTIPSILITCTMSIISFLSASTYFSENIRIMLGLIVGCLGSIGSLMQSFQSALNYNLKAESFRSAAENYDKLITKIKFELYNHDEKDFIDNLEKEVLKISADCKYFPPQSVKNMLRINTNIRHYLDKEHDEHTHQKVSGMNITFDK